MGAVSMAVAGIPDPVLSTAVTAAGTQVSVYSSVVAGAGNTLLAAKTVAGVVTNATVTLTLKDGNGDPIAFYPMEDMWLVTSLNGFVSCTPCLPVAGTNALGVTTFTAANLGKGHSNRNGGEKTQVLISGTPLAAAQNLDILYNSADYNGDNVVNGLDLGKFVEALKGLAADNYGADLQYDGAVNGLDFGIFVGCLKSTTQGCQ